MLRICHDHGFFRGEECPVCGDEGKFLMSSPELESLGRIMAGILRHFPDRFGLEMDEEGFVDIYKMVSAIKRKRGDKMRWLRPTHVIGLVETDPKGRYQAEDNHVRATYGHSIELSMSLPTDNIPDRLFFPARPDEVEELMRTGLHPDDRTMVHLSKTYLDAYEAGIHREGPDPVVLRIDAEGALNNGIIIQRAGKTVFTVEEIPPDFLGMSDDGDIESAKKELDERGSPYPTRPVKAPVDAPAPEENAPEHEDIDDLDEAPINGDEGDEDEDEGDDGGDDIPGPVESDG